MGRHPHVPSRTKLRRIGVTEEGGMQVAYFIPDEEKLKDAFKKALNVEL